MKPYRSVRDLPVEGKKVFLRADFNVPIEGGSITDDTRIRAALPTMRHLLERRASIVACSHLGRPKGKRVADLSLAPVAARLDALLPGVRVRLSGDVAGALARKAAGELDPGEVLLLENVRFEPGETVGDESLTAALRGLADFYVNDAFGAAHRAHVSVCALAKAFPTPAIGFLMEKELEYLERRLAEPVRPYTAFLGGAKVSDKIPVLRSLLGKVDALGIGGAMAYTFLLADGSSVGRSRCEPELLEECRQILEEARGRGVQVLLPVDHAAAPSLEEARNSVRIDGSSVPDELAAFDIGPKTSEAFATLAAAAGTVFWNGPMGVFERPPFDAGTLSLARALADSGAITVVGGGDSVAAVNRAGVADRISHISTGGGASLELLAGETLPGLEALRGGSA
jgi:phosphoglycerate kinase